MKIYNSLTRNKEEFEPLKDGRIGMYVCGPTVYDEPHIGHARSAYIFDVIRRYLEYKGYDVTFVRNVTDVDDKIIEKAKSALSCKLSAVSLKNKVREISKKYLDAYHDDMALLELGKPDKEPKATGYIKKMVNFIETLMNNGCAYEAEGDVYFDIKKAKNYGKLSNQNLDKMEAGARIAPGDKKRDPLDFALWKKAKEDEPSWDSPWGNGRPGWHIECSVMSSDILGDEFDIHGGGIDLIFPHHENEIAQSEGAGKGFARYWLHNGLLTINGEKMAKSLGNFISIKDFLAKYDADLLKLLFLSTHYRHPVDYSNEKIKEMKKEKDRFRILFQKFDRKFGSMNSKKMPTGSMGNIDKFKQEFEGAMDDDFNTPLALGVLFKMVYECNKILDNERDDRVFMLRYAKDIIIKFGQGIFGLSFKDISKEKSDTWVTIAIAERERLRKEKKFKEADKVRKMLDEKGIILEDTKEQTVWRRKS